MLRCFVIILIILSGISNARSDDDFFNDDSVITSSDDIHYNDPFEKFNRINFKLMLVGDRLILNPMAQIYNFTMPLVIKDNIENAVANTYMPITILNSTIAAKPGLIARSIARFSINSTFGIFGMFDVAQIYGIENIDVTLSDTISLYGFSQGPFFVTPMSFGSIFNVGNMAELYFYSRINLATSSASYLWLPIVRNQGEAGINLAQNAQYDYYPALRLFYYTNLNKHIVSLNEASEGKVYNYKDILADKNFPI